MFINVIFFIYYESQIIWCSQAVLYLLYAVLSRGRLRKHLTKGVFFNMSNIFKRKYHCVFKNCKINANLQFEGVREPEIFYA